MLTQKYIKSILDYNSNTGNLIWKRQKSHAKKGNIAGWVNPNNTMQIGIDVRY